MAAKIRPSDYVAASVSRHKNNTQRQIPLLQRGQKDAGGSNTQEFSERCFSFIRALGVSVDTDTIQRNLVIPVGGIFVCSSCYEHLPILSIGMRRLTQSVAYLSTLQFAIMTRHLQLLRDDAVFGQSPPRGTKILTLVQGNVARAQSRQRHVCVSVKLQYSHVVSMSDDACPLGVNVSCDCIKDLRRHSALCSIREQFAATWSSSAFLRSCIPQ